MPVVYDGVWAYAPTIASVYGGAKGLGFGIEDSGAGEFRFRFRESWSSSVAVGVGDRIVEGSVIWFADDNPKFKSAE
jgi:hypothetical protein